MSTNMSSTPVVNTVTKYLDQFKSRSWVETQLEMLMPGQRLINEVINCSTIPGAQLTRMRKPTVKDLTTLLELIGYTAVQSKKARLHPMKCALVMTWLKNESIYRPQRGIEHVVSNASVGYWANTNAGKVCRHTSMMRDKNGFNQCLNCIYFEE
jgi:hypothetical protein